MCNHMSQLDQEDFWLLRINDSLTLTTIETVVREDITVKFMSQNVSQMGW